MVFLKLLTSHPQNVCCRWLRKYKDANSSPISVWFFTWNMFLCLSVSLDPLCQSLCVDETAPLEGVALCGRWTLAFSPAQLRVVTVQAAYCIFNSSSSRGCANLWVCTGEDLGQHLNSGWLEARPWGSRFTVCRHMESCGTQVWALLAAGASPSGCVSWAIVEKKNTKLGWWLQAPPWETWASWSEAEGEQRWCRHPRSPESRSEVPRCPQTKPEAWPSGWSSWTGFHRRTGLFWVRPAVPAASGTGSWVALVPETPPCLRCSGGRGRAWDCACPEASGSSQPALGHALGPRPSARSGISWWLPSGPDSPPRPGGWGGGDHESSP